MRLQPIRKLIAAISKNPARLIGQLQRSVTRHPSQHHVLILILQQEEGGRRTLKNSERTCKDITSPNCDPCNHKDIVDSLSSLLFFPIPDFLCKNLMYAHCARWCPSSIILLLVRIDRPITYGGKSPPH